MRILFLIFFGYLVNYFYLSNPDVAFEVDNVMRGFMVWGVCMAVVQDVLDIASKLRR